ncbi:MAG: phasin family protein [Pseudomonadota bacterium]
MASTKETIKDQTADIMGKSQEFVTTHIANSEKAMDSLIELNAAMFKGGEAIAKKMYENYVSNVAATFDGVKALNKASDVSDFFKIATSNIATGTERLADQTKGVAELSGKVMKDTGEAARAAYSKGFAVNL